MFKIFFLLLISFVIKTRSFGGYTYLKCDQLSNLHDEDRFIIQSLNLINVSEPKLLIRAQQVVAGMNNKIVFKGKHLDNYYYFSVNYFRSLSNQITINRYSMTLNKADIPELKNLKESDYLLC